VSYHRGRAVIFQLRQDNPDQFGVMRPKDALLYASQLFQQAMYPTLLNQIRGLMGGSVIQLPATVGELRAADAAADIERYVRWPKARGFQPS
jgi:aromatic ring hydroxylase